MYDDLLLLQPAAAAAGTVVNPLTGLGGAAAQPLQQHMKHLGDFDGSTVIYGKFTTYRPSTGAAFTLGGTPALSVYKDNSTTQSTSGVTLTADFDAVTGLNHFAIDTSADGTFYSAGSNFDVVITTGTVDGVSVVGAVVASFTIRKDSALKSTTAGRTLDVSAGGEAGVDWANIGSPTTTVNLSGTTVKTATDVETDTADIQSRLPAALVSGRIDASVGAMATDVITSAALATSAVTEIQSGLATSAAVAAVQADTDDIQTRLPAALVGGRMDASVGAMAANTVTASALATDAVTEVVNGVWDEPLAGHATSGSTGAALSAAGSAGDPWSTALPGAYGTGTAGNIIGNNLNATVSSRLASASYTAPLDAAGTRSAVGLASANLDTQLSGIQSDTNDIQTRLPAALVGGRMDASVGAMAADVVTASAVAASAVTEIQSGLASQTSVDTLAGYVDTEVAAIKAQTDKLTFNASNAVKANITHVIDDAVQQNGSTTTNWGGTP